MATNAGQRISADPGFAEAKAEGKVKETTATGPTPPSGPLVPYESLVAISPPAFPKDSQDSGCPVASLHSDPIPLTNSELESRPGHESTDDNVLHSPTNHHHTIFITITTTTGKMASPQLIFVDGSFAELAQEMADYLHIGDAVKPLLETEKDEEALSAMVKASHALNSVPEKEFTGAYNLLIHLVLQAKDPKQYLPTICGNLLKPVTSSPVHGFTLAANALSAIFNLIDQKDPLRYKVFQQIVRFIRQHGQFELLKPRLKNLDAWFSEWQISEPLQRELLVDVSDAAEDSGDEEEAYHYLLKAIATFDREDQEEIASEEAQRLSLKALKMAISSPTRFDFQDLRSLPSVQALNDSQPVYSQLLDIFTEQDLEDYNDFRDEHEGWIEKEKLDHDKLQRKMRLLTFASLAASTPNREIPYANIAKALQIPSEDVEMWTIDVVRAKLVEGRLSQKQKVFLVHRTTYRVFGEKQWRELGTRVDQFKVVVDRLTSVVRKAQADAEAQKERELQELERKLNSTNVSGALPERRRQQKQRTDDDD
ncbi:hypothetical protein QBC44DRAFT_389473 [Cladorrhinum sp. PSN332]|nr:hypothetical protein QBC44DRAFT_389473 [Cladorrhinum sp. PSN332]